VNGWRGAGSGCGEVVDFDHRARDEEVMALNRLGDGQQQTLWSRIKRIALTDVGALMRGLNAEDLEKMERVLIEADFGVAATVELTQALEDEVRRGKLKTEADLKGALQERLVAMLEGAEDPGALARPAAGPAVILIVGVNGTGKTTTAAKLARRLQREGHSVLLAAADTYRAGAIAQLQVWANRLGIPCVAGAPGGDPASVAFDAIDAAISRGLDTVIIDTAGRLHTQDGLMEELRKITRVIGRRLPGAPHETLLILDGTVGQNAIQQGTLFSQAVSPTGIIVTKLDGSARGGAVAALRRELGLPIRFLGLGESLEDLEPFDPERFAENLLAETPVEAS
jgi:fused signal recognition particle receptor